MRRWVQLQKYIYAVQSLNVEIQVYMYTGGLHTYIYIHMHIHVHTCMHTYIHACIHTYIHTYIHTCIHAYIHTNLYDLETRLFQEMAAGWQSSAARSFLGTDKRLTGGLVWGTFAV